jgi:hypothetical protein
MRVGETPDRQNVRGKVNSEYGKGSLIILSYRKRTVRLLVPDDAEQFKALRFAVDNAPNAIWPTARRN